MKNMFRDVIVNVADSQIKYMQKKSLSFLN